MDLQLKGKRALITGASKGIGYAIAQRLAQEGCEVVLVARTVPDLDRAASALRQETGVAVHTLALDMGAPGAAKAISERHPEIDILVNNAGDIPGGTLEEVSDEAWRAAWDVKVFGYIDLCRVYFPRMKNRNGVMLNIIGAAGDMLDAGYIAGSVGNAALMAFTRSLGSTSIEQGVRVIGINPGPVFTDRQQKILRKRAAERLGDAERWPELERNMPTGRSATTDEVAASAVFLCSPLCSYTSGAILTIDGGLSIRRSIA